MLSLRKGRYVARLASGPADIHAAQALRTLTFRGAGGVPDVDAWYAWAEANAVPGLTKMFDSDELGIRAFAMNDPEGYQIEVQTARPGH